MPALESHWCFDCHSMENFESDLKCPACGHKQDYIRFGLYPIPLKLVEIGVICSIGADCQRIGIDPRPVLMGLARILNHDFPVLTGEVPAV